MTAGIVRILAPDGSVVGTGFVVTDEGLVAACSHVVQSEKPQRRGDRRPDYVALVPTPLATAVEAGLSRSGGGQPMPSSSLDARDWQPTW